jgi:2-iminoacetate synthase
MNLNQIENYLYDKSPELLESLAQRAEQLTRQRFGHTMQMFAPLYLSNECVDTCTYCGFSRPNEIERKTLSMAQVIKEAHYLIDSGFRHLLLVSGEHPQKVSPAYLSEIAQALRPHLASLSIEVAPFEQAAYCKLTQAGVDGVIVYQETYDRERYAEVHVAGPKRDYDKRIAAPQRAAAGGVRRLGMGILLGLADWRQDALQLVEHVRSLRKKYWQLDYQVSLPRLRPCAGGLANPVIVSDADYVKLVCLLRLALPEVGIVLSTREPKALRDGLMRLGVTHMSAGSQTQPGGYAEPAQATEQFEISDERSPEELAMVLRRKQIEPVWKDWDAVLYGQ